MNANEPRAEEELRKSEVKYRNLVENSLQGLAIIQDFRIVFCNNAYANMTGYSVKELLSFSPEEVNSMIHPEDRALVWARYRDRLAGKLVPSHYEFRGIGRAATECWHEIYASLIEYNGKPAIQIAFLDITERKHAEESLRKSEERFRLIAETIDEIFWMADVESGAITYISPAHERILGYPRQRLYEDSKSFYDPIHPDDRDRVAATMALLKTGQPIKQEYHHIVPAA